MQGLLDAILGARDQRLVGDDALRDEGGRTALQQPWLRTTMQTAPQSVPQGSAQPNPQGQGQAPSQQTEWWQAIDWRLLLLAFGVLSIAFTLIVAGYSALKK